MPAALHPVAWRKRRRVSARSATGRSRGRIRVARGAADRAPDALVGAAAAEVPGHRRADLLVPRPRILGEQCGRAQDLARLTVAALRDALRDPGPLEPVQAALREPLDGEDAPTRGVGR